MADSTDGDVKADDSRTASDKSESVEVPGNIDVRTCNSNMTFGESAVGEEKEGHSKNISLAENVEDKSCSKEPNIATLFNVDEKEVDYVCLSEVQKPTSLENDSNFEEIADKDSTEVENTSLGINVDEKEVDYVCLSEVQKPTSLENDSNFEEIADKDSTEVKNTSLDISTSMDTSVEPVSFTEDKQQSSENVAEVNTSNIPSLDGAFNLEAPVMNETKVPVTSEMFCEETNAIDETKVCESSQTSLGVDGKVHNDSLVQTKLDEPSPKNENTLSFAAELQSAEQTDFQNAVPKDECLRETVPSEPPHTVNVQKMSSKTEEKSEPPMQARILDETAVEISEEIDGEIRMTKELPAINSTVTNSSSSVNETETDTRIPALVANITKQQESHVKPEVPVDSGKPSAKAEARGPENSANQTTVSKKGFSQLEQMSHENLLKQCKKQLLFLQKTKAKTDELSRNLQDLQSENKMLKEASTKSGVSVELLRQLQSENDRLQDEKESQAESITQLKKDVERLVTDLTSCKEQMEDSKGKCNQLKDSLTAFETEKKRLDGTILQLQSQVIVLRTERDSVHSEARLRDSKTASLEEEVKRKSQMAAELQASLDQLKQELEQGKVLSLEIGDYERSLSDLKEQLDEKNKMTECLNEQLVKKQQEQGALEQQIGHLEQQCLTEEGRSAHLKETLEATRFQLACRCQELSDLSATLQELKDQKESILASKEELQFQLSTSASQVTVLETELKQNREQSEKLDVTLKSRISSLADELAVARQELESSKKEFHNYKVRVHSVLKQQKTSTPGQPVSNLSALEEDQKGQMEWSLELYKGKLAQMNEQIGTLTLERDSLQKEQEWLLSKQNLLNQQMQEKEEILMQRVEELQQQLDLNRSLWETEKHQLLQQQQSFTSEFEHCLASRDFEHEKHVSSLISEIENLQRSITILSPLSVEQSTPRPCQQNQIFNFLPGTQLSPSVDESFDICSQERQEGEGSECTDTLPAPAAFQTLVTSPASGFLPLERLLQAEPTSMCHQDPEIVAINMNTLQKKVDHISELLNESEASNLRLSEQTRLLKEEIRRLERNSERQEHFANLEYLKNIVLKFNTLPNGSERERLVPVLSTLLRLSPEEQAQMISVVSEGNPGASSDAPGWGSYLHRWSGFV